MPGPFPGMDPYLEDPVLWPGVHHGLIGAIRAALNRELPPGYVASVDERVYVLPPNRSIYPDVLLIRREEPSRQPIRAPGGVAVADEPVTWEFSLPAIEIHEPYIEIRTTRPERKVVTLLEVLSPANKASGSAGRDLYKQKQQEALQAGVNLVEIDLLRAGEHTVAPLELELRARGSWHYLVSVCQVPQRWRFTVYPILLTEHLPKVRIPLHHDTPAVELELQAALVRCYEEGRYGQEVDYTQEPPTPLPEELRGWADALLRERGLRA